MSETKVLLIGQVRVYVSDMTQVAQTAMRKQSASPLSAHVLSTAISIFAPVALLKKEGEVHVFVRTPGLIRSIIVEASTKGTLRALVGNAHIATEFDKKRFNEIPLALALGESGFLRLNHFYKQNNFSGEVELVKRDLVTDLAYYFAQSEQIYTAIVASVKLKTPKTLLHARSAIFQLLPGHTAADATWVEEFVKSHQLSNMTTDEYIAALKTKPLSTHQWRWKCLCSSKKAEQVLSTLSISEQEDLIKTHGHTEVVCSFCQRKYQFKTPLKPR